MVSITNSNNDQIIGCLKTIRETVDRLQELLGAPGEDTAERFYRRRRELLTRIFATGGLSQNHLFRLLDEHSTPHQWIGQQGKAKFLEMVPWPGESDRYVATRKAVQEFDLQREAETLASMSEQVLDTDWDAEEDMKYDHA